MAFGGYVYQGYQDRNDELDNQRMKTAKAFEEYKKANPYATTQELRDAVDQFAGSSPYLRSGAATEETIKDIARRNSEANYARERDLYMKNTAAKKQSQEDLNNSVYGFYEQSGDIGLAIKNAQSQLQALKPQNEFQSDQLKGDMDYLSGLNPEVIEDEFIQQYFDNNNSRIMSQINAGTDYGKFSQDRGQPIVSSQAFRNRYESEFAPVLEQNQQAAHEKLVSLMSNPSYLNMVGTGNLDPIKQAMGRFSGFIDDKVIEDYASDQVITAHQAKRATASAEARTYADGLASQNRTDLDAMLSGIGKDIDNQASRATLQAFSQTHNTTNSNAVIELATALHKEGRDISPEKMKQILNEFKGNGFVDENTFSAAARERFMTQSGVGPEPTTQTDFVMDAFGDGVNDKGVIGTEMLQFGKTVDELLQSTVDLISLPKNQSRHGSNSYDTHGRAIGTAISQLKQRRQQIVDMGARAERTAGFMPTVNEDFNANKALARQQVAVSIQKIDEHLNVLAQKSAEVSIEGEIAEKRQNGLATSSDFLPGSSTLSELANFVDRKGYTQALKSGNPPAGVIDDIMREAGLSPLAYKNAYGGGTSQFNSPSAALAAGQIQQYQSGSYNQSSVFPNQNNGPDYNSESQAIIDALISAL